MSDTFFRHLVALCGLLIAGLAYLSGYVSGGHGWWWTAIGLILIYVALYKLVAAGHH